MFTCAKHGWRSRKTPCPVCKEVSNVPEKTAEELIAPESPWDGLSEEEILYWATPHYDQIQAEKEKRKEAEREARDRS